MLFHTLDYLLFLPLCVLLYWLAPAKARLAVLGVVSLVFYASWNIAYLPVLLGVILLAWLGGIWAAERHEEGGRSPWRMGLLLFALLLPLLYFKYWNWIADNIDWLVRNPDWALPRVPASIALPVGISFFTFQALAYVIDVRRGEVAERDVWKFGTFITYFPQLIAGPIVRRHELLPQLNKLPLLAQGDIAQGLFRIARGIVKKVLIADIVRVGIVDPMFEDPSLFTGVELMIGLYAYTIQIYYDFSGYTDMAIGSARLFGIKLPENFRRPYKATSVAGFWRRWHITLSNWVRDYIYFTMGGARSEREWKIYRNIMLTLLIIGMWHGASWNFFVYGTLHGLGVAINRLIRKRTGRRPDDPLPHLWGFIWRWTLTFHFVVLARILFRAPDFAVSWEYLVGLTGSWGVLPRFSLPALGTMLVGYLIHFSPDDWQEKAKEGFSKLGPAGWAIVFGLVGIACLLFGSGEQLAFIYYQF